MIDIVKDDGEMMSEDKNKAIEKVKEYAPSAQAWGRALIAGIPVVGGCLDHLIFDKASEIRIQRLEQSVKNIEEIIYRLDEGRVKLEWFESIEALDMLKQLFNKVEYEPSDSKVKTLSQTYALFGTKEHSEDPNKYAMLDTISKMTDNQRVVFKAANEVPQETKTISAGAIEHTIPGRWQSTMLDYIKQSPILMGQLQGHVKINIELDILTSFNLLYNLDAPSNEDAAYRITQIGKLAYSYLKETT